MDKMPVLVRLMALYQAVYLNQHDDVIKWKHFPRYWPFVRGIHRSPVNSPHKGQWRGALIFFFDLCLNKRSSKNREVGDLRRYRAHNDVTVMNIDPLLWRVYMLK